MKLGKAFMMFGAPAHRLEAQMQATARVLELDAQVVCIPGIMLLSFGDPISHTSEIKFIKQSSGLDLGKLDRTYKTYWDVIYDKISVVEASTSLDTTINSAPKYRTWQKLMMNGLAVALILPSAFHGSL